MGRPHLVKVGLLGLVGRFDSTGWRAFARDDRVVCRTSRGLEIGRVMCALDIEDSSRSDEIDGQVLRRVSHDDELIVNRIERFRDRAFDACNRLLRRRKLNAVLVDVEHLFDGQSLYFYFLGDVPVDVQSLTAELGEEYERKVRFRKFTETLVNGCGPGCGAEAAKCSTGACSSCGVNGGCGSVKK